MSARLAGITAVCDGRPDYFDEAKVLLGMVYKPRNLSMKPALKIARQKNIQRWMNMQKTLFPPWSFVSSFSRSNKRLLSLKRLFRQLVFEMLLKLSGPKWSFRLNNS